ncbi:MAG: hypothetical protein ACR2MG_09465 [Pyrinomonadaceae bacterium]
MIDLKEFPYYEEFAEECFQLGRVIAADRIVFQQLKKKIRRTGRTNKISITAIIA